MTPLVRREHRFAFQGSHLVDLDAAPSTLSDDHADIGVRAFGQLQA